MADVIVPTAELQLRTCKLTKSILKQMPVLVYERLRSLGATGSERTDEEIYNNIKANVVGWINAVALGIDMGDTALIIKVSEGQYGIFQALHSARRSFQQIYIV